MFISALFVLPLLFPTLLCATAPPAFHNPIIYADVPDNDVSVGPDGLFYLSASNFHYSPGAPILRSADLATWSVVGHSIPSLAPLGAGYSLPASSGERAYRGGTWASTLRYRPGDATWYWIGCTNFWNTWVYTSPAPEGPWIKRAQYALGLCFYDCGLLVDDDDALYVVYGSGEIKVAQLSPDATAPIRTETVLRAADVGADGLEGSRLYRVNGTYYILNDHPGTTAYVWRSATPSPWGPYEARALADNVQSPMHGGGPPHQGSLVRVAPRVDAQGKVVNGGESWFFVSFTWAYPAGRLPVIAPVVWGADGFPSLVTAPDGSWAASYLAPERPSPSPDVVAAAAASWTGTEAFNGTKLSPAWEWNHAADESRYELVSGGGLRLRTASVTDDLYSARNTLTRRIYGEWPAATAMVDFADMADGDRCGLAAFRDRSAYVGLHRDGGGWSVVAKFNMSIDEFNGSTIDMGAVVGAAAVPSGVTRVWLRAQLDARPDGSNVANFSYSWDGNEFVGIGGTYKLYTGWAFFLGYRFAVFNHATKSLDGSVTIEEFTTA